MDYKKIIRSRSLRTKILQMLNWVPDNLMVYMQYWIHTGRKPNFKSPYRFTEKLQLYKLWYRNPEMLRCTDKYEVRKFVSDKKLDDILIKLIGVYDNIDAINFNNLPLKFVAKTTDGGGGRQILICRDKHKFSETNFRDKLSQWMDSPKSNPLGREWAYKNGFPRRIIIEQLIDVEKSKGLQEYKFFCFNGKVTYVYGISDRKVGESAQIGIYDLNFNKLDVDRCDERHQEKSLAKPKNYEKMVSIAERLSEEFPHVRVDLYNVDGTIYFGELTFYDGSGYMTFFPDCFDYELGKSFIISSFWR